MPNGGLGGGGGMANEQKRQFARGGGRGLPSINLPRTPENTTLDEEERGAKRQLSPSAQQAGAVGRGRSLRTLGGGGLARGARRVGKGLGNRSLGRFRRPQ